MNFVKSKCYAKVDMSHDILRDLTDSELLELYSVLGIVLRMEDRIYSMTHELLIAHPRFRELSDGEIIPRYILRVERHPWEKLDIRFIPVDDEQERVKTYSDGSII